MYLLIHSQKAYGVSIHESKEDAVREGEKYEGEYYVTKLNAKTTTYYPNPTKNKPLGPASWETNPW